MKGNFIIHILTGTSIAFLAPLMLFAQETAVPAPSVSAPAPAEVMPQPTVKPVEERAPAPPPPPPSLESEKGPGIPEEDRREEFVDPQEIRDVLRQIKDIKREANRIIKKATKAGFTAETAKLNELVMQVSATEAALRGSKDRVSRDTLQDFYDAQIWDTMNNIRVKIELPNELKGIEREMKRLEKMINKKTFVVEGIDMEKVRVKIEEVKAAVSHARENLAQGNLEEAQEAMQVVYEDGAHPGEMFGVLNRLAEMTRRLKVIKSESVRSDIQEVLAPVYDAVNSGDFREANTLINEVDQELWKVMSAVRNKSNISNDMRNRLQRLEEKLQQTIQREEQQKPEEKRSMGNTRDQLSYYTYKNYSASLWEKVVDWFGF